MTPEHLASLMYHTQFRFSSEADLQEAIEALYVQNGVSYVREARLNAKDRIDFMVGGIGVEVKVDSSLNSVQRQLWRYAASDAIDSLVLVTTKAAHKNLPEFITGKPLYVVHLLHSFF